MKLFLNYIISRIDVFVRRLYSGMPCTACGLRFLANTQTSRYADHLDWHFRQNRKERKGSIQTHREWYYTASVRLLLFLLLLTKHSSNGWHMKKSKTQSSGTSKRIANRATRRQKTERRERKRRRRRTTSQKRSNHSPCRRVMRNVPFVASDSPLFTSMTPKNGTTKTSSRTKQQVNFQKLISRS